VVATGGHFERERDEVKWGKTLLRPDAGVPVGAVVEVGAGGTLESGQRRLMRVKCWQYTRRRRLLYRRSRDMDGRSRSIIALLHRRLSRMELYKYLKSVHRRKRILMSTHVV